MSASLYDLFAAQFPEDRSASCMTAPGASPFSYGELEEAADRVARRLLGEGVEPGDRVVVQARKSPAFVAVYLGALKAGAVFVPLNPAYTEPETAYFLADCGAKIVLRDADAYLAGAPRGAPVESVARNAGDLASLIYTSGTTGRSKGAMLSHGNLASNAIAVAEAWGYTRDDVLIHALPVFHVHGLFIAMHCALLRGAPMIWLERFDEGDVIAAMDGASVLMGVPTFYTRLLACADFTRARAATMRLFVSGSAPLLPQTFAAFEARTGKRILERYGMSEAIVIASNPLDGERVAGSVGLPLPGTRARIAGGAEVGEIEIAGPSVFSGYWGMSEKTAEAFTPDGYFRTGDVGRIDGEGRVWISGRAKDLVISGGFNVYPKEIELVLDACAGVKESAVIGVPHPDFGEAVVAVVEGEGEAQALIAAARESLAAYKVPKRVIFVEALPRNAMGKVQKNDLRARYAAVFAHEKEPE